ncbi:hypothetical protein ACNVED_14880 (plasmid) [Legionella sp. D16C41]|uniref:hypothetical protein n=1 Tax=Legionella sp. D16C41 TaxID=3402688 RepID=UPI003AF9FF85
MLEKIDFNKSNKENLKKEVEKNWKILGNISLASLPSESNSTFKTYLEICQTAVEQHPDALQLVKLPENKNIISDDYLKLYLIVCNHKFRSQNHLALLPIPNIENIDHLTENQLQLLAHSVKLNRLWVLGLFDKVKKENSLYRYKLEFLIKLIDMEDTPLTETAIREVNITTNGPLLEQEKEFYIKYIKRYPGALTYIYNKEILTQIINTLTLEFFLLRDISLIQHMPKELQEEANKSFPNFFKDKLYFIITPEPLEGEIKDAYLAYINHPKRLNKCYRIPDTFSKASFILEKISCFLNEEAKLVFIGHTTKTSDKIGEYGPEKISSLLKIAPKIKEIILLGCQTAVLEKSEEEKKLITDYRSQNESTGFIMYHAEADIQEKIKIISTKNTNNFVLIPGNKPRLIYINNREIILDKIINSEQMKEILELVSNKKFAKIILPSSKRQQITLKDKVAPLPPHEIESVLNIAKNRSSILDRSDKEDYTHYKAIFPHLRTFVLTDHDLKKLDKNCLLSKVLENLRQENIKSVIIKAYTGVICVDTQEYRFYSIHSGGNVYKNDNTYKISFFECNTSNIDQDKLRKEQRQEIKNLDKDNPLSVAKSIKVMS